MTKSPVMARRGRPAKIARSPYVLTHGEVTRDYFRRAPASLPPEVLANLPGFPEPNRAGLYLRKAVEDWVDRDHGFTAKSADIDYEAIALERARGKRRDQTSPAQTA